MEIKAQVLLERLREAIERSTAPEYHDSVKESPRYWSWRVQKAFIDTGRDFGGLTILPPSISFNPRTRRITSNPDDAADEAAQIPQVVDVAWLRDHRFSLEAYQKGRTGIVAGFMAEWGSRHPYHVARGQMNWADVRSIMGAFCKLAFIKSPVKVMGFTTRSMKESGGDNWDFLTNMMTAQAKAMFRYYPVREEYVLLAWPFGTPSLSNFRYRIVKVG